jgi:hypothetical protein
MKWCLALLLVAACSKDGAADRTPPRPRPADAPAPPKDPPMTDDKPVTKAPPPLVKPPPEDPARYVEWMQKRGTPIPDKAREDTSLRIGNWGFFDHGSAFRDRAALDRAGHAVVASDKGDWYALLSTAGLDAAGALKRAAWLFASSGLEPATAPKVNHRDKLTPPTLVKAKDGTITFQGFWVSPPQMSDPLRVTITAPPKGQATLVFESANKL